MALPGLTSFKTAETLLFSILPGKLFSPLASVNRDRYWSILCRLHNKRFGPDAPMPPSNGIPARDIIQDIEDILLIQDAWEAEDTETFETPIEQRAATIFNRLHESGWFRVDRPRYERRVAMQPEVSQFLSMLINFAETGPVFVLGKINSINANLKMIISKESTGNALMEAAEQSRNLLEYVRNTGMNIRDIMDSLKQDVTTANYVNKFFNDYVESVFIGDYKELHTNEHPLAKSGAILDIVETIWGSPELKDGILNWYESKRAPGNPAKALYFFERDMNRLTELQKIGDYLKRLDEEIKTANRRACVFIDYRMRSLMPTDHMVKRAIESLQSNGDPQMADPFPPSDLMSEGRLAEPRKKTERAPPSVLRKVVVSDEQRALSNILKRARQRRTVNNIMLTSYVKEQLSGQPEINSHELTVTGIPQLRMFQSLAALSLRMNAKGPKVRLDAMAVTKGYRVHKDPGAEEKPTGHITTEPFTIKNLSSSKKTGASE